MNRFGSIINQLLQLFPGTEFQAAVNETRAERHARGFTCWGKRVAMIFFQLGRAHSLHEICVGPAGYEGKLKRLLPFLCLSRWNHPSQKKSPFDETQKLVRHTILPLRKLEGRLNKSFSIKRKKAQVLAVNLGPEISRFGNSLNPRPNCRGFFVRTGRFWSPTLRCGCLWHQGPA